METFQTKYGKLTLYKNDVYIINSFINNEYWEEDTLLKLKRFINPNKNILEIGGHCGTSSIVYASFLNDDKKVFVYEPQKNLFDLLVKNINDNNLQNKIIPFNQGVFCYEGQGKMSNIDLDGGYGIVQKRYNEEQHLSCNFGGISLGNDGEFIKLTTIDNMKHEDIGFIHCDAQGSENFIFSKATQTITKYKPVIFYENNSIYGKYLYNSVCKSYPSFENESKFNINEFCFKYLKYMAYIEKFNEGIDTLLIP